MEEKIGHQLRTEIHLATHEVKWRKWYYSSEQYAQPAFNFIAKEFVHKRNWEKKWIQIESIFEYFVLNVKLEQQMALASPYSDEHIWFSNQSTQTSKLVYIKLDWVCFEKGDYLAI